MSTVPPLVECVPNFSEGRDPAAIRQITDAIEAVDGIRLLDVDPGKATHRTVVTFVGAPEAVAEAAFRAIRAAAAVIDMRAHHGEHPRMGATDVCPLVPVAGIGMEAVVDLARDLGRRVGEELGIPVYLYERAATRSARRNLATIRAGEYEGLPEKLRDPEWAPDFGPAVFNPQAGATVIGARDFLVAYNVNLNTTSTRRASAVAFDVREQGRQKRSGDPLTGPLVRDAAGEPVWEPGLLKAVKAIGWYIPEYGVAQVSMNLTDLEATPLHTAFEACCERAEARGMRVTGSELVGMVPLRVLLDAGRHFLRKQQRSVGVPEAELVRIAVRSLGLDDLAPFDPAHKVIEYRLRAGRRRPSPSSGCRWPTSPMRRRRRRRRRAAGRWRPTSARSAWRSAPWWPTSRRTSAAGTPAGRRSRTGPRSASGTWRRSARWWTTTRGRSTPCSTPTGCRAARRRRRPCATPPSKRPTSGPSRCRSRSCARRWRRWR